MSRLSDAIEVVVGPNARYFWPKFKAQVSKGVPEVNVEVNPELRRARRELATFRKVQEANALHLRVNLDKRSMAQAEAGIKRIQHTWTQSNFSRAIRVNLMVGGAASLPSMIQGLMSLTTAVTELGRAALVLPGLLAGVGAAAGTAALGVKDVVEALKEADKGMDNTAQKMRTFNQASRDLEKAQRDVVDALKEANREIEDQRTKLTRNQLSVEQAQLNLQKANQKLSKGGFDSVSDWRQAVIDQKQAVLDLNDAVNKSKRDIQDYYDTNKKGATESDKFKDSLDRLATAMENLEKRQLEAQGVTEKFVQAMKGLSPAAQDFVIAVKSLNGSWNDLKKAASQKLFDGLGKELTDLSNKRMPMVKRGVEQVAQGLNASIRQIIQSIGNDANSNALAKIAENTGVALERMRPGLDSLINGFMKLSEVGSRFLPRLAGAFNSVMGRFESFIDRAEKDGSLESWIDGGLRSISSLGRSLQNIMSIFGSITKAYQTATGNLTGFIGTAEGLLGRWAKEFASPEGQRRMVGWITKSREFIDEIKKSLPGIRKIFGQLGDAARQFATIVFPYFAKLGELMERYAGLVQTVFTLWASWRTIAPIIEMYNSFKNSFSGGVSKYRELVQSQKELTEARKLDAAVAQRQAAQEKINFQLLQSQNKWKLKAAQDEVKAKGAAVDAARKELLLNKTAIRQAQNNLSLMSNMGGEYGTSIPPVGPVGKKNRKAVRERRLAGGGGEIGITERIAQLRPELAAWEKEILRVENRISNFQAVMDDTGIAKDIKSGKRVRLYGKSLGKNYKDVIGKEVGKLEDALQDAVANRDAIKWAIDGGLEEGRERAWRQVQDLLDKDEKLTKKVAAAEADAATATKKSYEVKRGIISSEVAARENLTAATARSTKATLEASNMFTRAAARVPKDAGLMQRVYRGLTWSVGDWLNSIRNSAGAGNIFTRVAGKIDADAEGMRGRFRDLTYSVGKSIERKQILARTVDKVSGKFTSLRNVIGSGIGKGGGGVVGSLGALTAAMSTMTTAIGFGASIGLMIALEKLAEAHQKAGDRAAYQRDMEAQLANTLDQATGATTLAGVNAALDRGRSFEITGADNKSIKVDAVAAANQAGVGTALLRQSLDPTQTAANRRVQETFDNQTAEAIRAGKDPQWNKFGKQLKEYGVDEMVYAKAINGDQEAVDKFLVAQEKIFQASGQADFDPFGINRRLASRGGVIPDLGRGAEALNSAGVSSVAASQFQRSTEAENARAGAGFRSANEKAYLKPNGPFPGAENAYWEDDGTTVAFDMNNLNPDQQRYFRNVLGADLRATQDPERFVVRISGDLVEKWVQPRGYEPAGFARGGSVWGAGTSTSDSIPALLSNGEYVINAKSAKIIGHENLNRINSISGTPGPSSPGRFAPGGPVKKDESGLGDLLGVGDGLTAGSVSPIPGATSVVPLGPPDPTANPLAKLFPDMIGPTRSTDWMPGAKAALDAAGYTAPSPPPARTNDIPSKPNLNGLPHAGKGQPGPDGPRSTTGFPVYGSPYGGLNPPRTPTVPSAPVSFPSGYIPTFDQLPGAGGIGAAGPALSRSGLTGLWNSLQAGMGGPSGLALMPLFGENPQSMSFGNLTTGAAWSTMKLPVALAALRESGSVSQDIVAAITNSDNAAAERLWSSLGDPQMAASKVQAILREAGDSETVVNSVKSRPEFSSFGQTSWSLDNQLRFLAYLNKDPKNAPLIDLMTRVSSDQRWGLGQIPGAAFKGGWGPDAAGQYLTRQIGIIDGPGGKYAIAIANQPSNGQLDAGNSNLTAAARWLQDSALTPANFTAPDMNSPAPVLTGPGGLAPKPGMPVQAGNLNPAGARSLAAELAKSATYSMGGFSKSSMDCSGLVSAVVNSYLGQDPFTERMNTTIQGDWLARRGFLPGKGPEGSLRVGWYDRGGGENGHTAMTLPDGTTVEASGPPGSPLKFGTGGGADQPIFDQFMYLPASSLNSPDGSIPVIPDVSQMTPPPGAVDPNAGSGRKKDGIPGITAPIPGPFGDIPFQPFDILREIGKALLGGILGFFGIDSSSIVNLIESIFGGIDDMNKDKPEAEGDPGIIPEENPDPNIDPGPDPKVIDDLVKAANDAKAKGDNELSKQLLARAEEYRQSRLRSSAPPSTLGSLTMDSSQDDVAKAILSEARSRGYSKEQAQAILATAITESGGLNPRSTTQQGRWRGIFGDPTNPFATDFSDPNINIGGFFDRLETRRATGDIWQAIYWSQKSPDATTPEAAMSNLDKGYMDGIKSAASLDSARRYMEAMGYAGGGYVRGPGTSTSDSIPAMLSDGEYVIRAEAVKNMGVHRLNAINAISRANGGLVRAFAPGGPVNLDPLLNPPPPEPVNPPPDAIPPAPPAGAADAPVDPTDLSRVESLGKVAEAVGNSILTPKGGGSGGSASAKAPRSPDPRATLAAAPTSDNYLNPALSAGIKGAAGTIGALAGTAAAAGIASTGVGAPAAGAASTLISAGANMAGDLIAGGWNVLSALGVGTVTPSETGQGYGAPLLPAPPQQQPVSNFQSIHNGDVVTNNLTEYQRLMDRKEAQKSAPFFNRVNS